MKESIKRSLLMAGLLAIVGASGSAHALDWTIPGANCEASLGFGGPDGNQAFEAEGGSAVAVCPFVKSAGTDNLTSAWVRWERGGSTSSFINCTVIASNSTGTVNDTDWQQAPSGAGPGTLSLPIPAAVSNGGYLSVMCVLSDGDKIHGIRLIQN